MPSGGTTREHAALCPGGDARSADHAFRHAGAGHPARGGLLGGVAQFVALAGIGAVLFGALARFRATIGQMRDVGSVAVMPTVLFDDRRRKVGAPLKPPPMPGHLECRLRAPCGGRILHPPARTCAAADLMPMLTAGRQVSVSRPRPMVSEVRRAKPFGSPLKTERLPSPRSRPQSNVFASISPDHIGFSSSLGVLRLRRAQLEARDPALRVQPRIGQQAAAAPRKAKGRKTTPSGRPGSPRRRIAPCRARRHAISHGAGCRAAAVARLETVAEGQYVEHAGAARHGAGVPVFIRAPSSARTDSRVRHFSGVGRAGGDQQRARLGRKMVEDDVFAGRIGRHAG